MSKKIILTESQRDLIVEQIVSEMLKDVDRETILSDEPINEGVWTNIKYGLSKLGRYKAGGKIFGKGKVDQEAGAKIQSIIDKKGNELIKKLDAEIKQMNPEFPNNREPADFLNTIIAISTVYDSIIAATQKDPKDEKYIPIDAANGIINDLREYVKKFLDVDLKAIYSTVDEAEGNVVELSEEELKEIDEAWGITEEDYFNEGVIDEDQAADVRKQLKTKRGAGADFQSDRMKTLKSNKLPLILAGIGGSLGALGWIAQTDWFKTWLESILGADTTVTEPDILKTINNNDPSPKGMLHWMGQIDGTQMKTGADVQAFIEKYGADNVKHMFEGNGGGPIDTQIQQLQQLVSGENASKPVGQLFNPSNDTFGSMKGGQNLFGISKAASFLAKVVIKKGTTTLVKGAGTALAAKLAGIGAVLAPIGIGVLATGALVKLMRMKGQKQSRAATLNDLYQSIRNIEGGVGVVKPEGPTIDAGSAQDPKAIETKNKEEGGGDATGGAGGSSDGAGKGGGVNDDLYNSLLNLFRFISASENKFGTTPKLTPNTQVTWSAKNKNGENVKRTGIVSKQKSNNPDETYVIPKGAKKGSKPVLVKNNKLKMMSENIVSETILSEAKYFRDKELVDYLNKTVSPARVKEFENLLNRIEQLRNKIRNIKNSNDKVFNEKIQTFKKNPIILTDFNKMFNVSSTNPQAYENLAKFINDIFKTLYTSNYKDTRLIIKLAGMDKVNVADNNISEDQFSRTQIEKDAQDRKKFKKHLMQFLTDSIELFKYMLQQKKNIAAQSGQKQNTNKQAEKLGVKPKIPRKKQGVQQQTPSEPDAEQQAPSEPNAEQPTSEPEEKKLKYSGVKLENKLNNENKLLSEEINKINKLINKIN